METRTVTLKIDAKRSLKETKVGLKDLDTRLKKILSKDHKFDPDKKGKLKKLKKELQDFPKKITTEIDVKNEKSVRRRLSSIGDGIGTSIKGSVNKVDWQGLGRRTADKLGKGLRIGAGIAGVAVAGLISSSISDAVELDKGARNVASLGALDLTETNKLLDEFSAKTKQTRQEGIEPLYDAISAGIVPQDQLLGFLEDANRFAIAGQLDDSTQAVSVLNTALANFGSQGLTSAQAADTLTATVQGFRTTLQDLGPAIGVAAPSANQLGLSFSELNASLGILTLGSGDSAKSATQLSAALDELSNPTTKVAKEFKDLAGVDVSTFLSQGNELTDVLDLLGAEADANGGKLVDFFGGGESKKAITNLTKDAGQLETAIADLNKAKNDAKVTDEAFAVQNQSTANVIDRAQDAYTNFKTELGVALSPAFADFLTEVSAALSNLDTTELTTSIGEASPAIADMVVNLVELIPAFVELATVIAGVVNKLAELGILDDLVLLGVLSKIVPVTSAFSLGSKAISRFGGSATKAGPGLTKFSGSISKLTTRLSGSFSKGSGVATKSLSKFGTQLGKIGGNVAKTGPKIAKFGGALTKGIGGNIAKMAPKLASFALSLGPVGLIAVAVIGLGIVIYKNWDKIKAFLDKIWGGIKKAAGAVWEGIKTAITNPIELTKALIENRINFVKDLFNFSGLLSTVTAVWDGIKDAMFRPVRQAWELISPIVDRIRGALSFIGIGGGSDAPTIVPGAAYGAAFTHVKNGFVSKKPQYAISEFGHTEVVLPENAGVNRLETLLGQTNILGRLHESWQSQNTTTNNNSNVRIEPQVHYYESGGKSAGARRLSAGQVANQVADEIFGRGVRGAF